MIHRVFNCNKMYAAFIAFDGLESIGTVLGVNRDGSY